MLSGFRARFLRPRPDHWFCEGLVIASASPRTVRQVLRNLSCDFPFVNWDLLSRHEYPEFPFRSSFLIRRPLGGLRLLWSARKHFEIVVLMGARSDRALRLHCWAALLLMRPVRFFVFVEGGDGFWLSVDDASALRQYYPRFTWFAEGFRPGPRSFVSQISARLRQLIRATRSLAVRMFAAAAAFAMRIVRCVWIAAGAALIFLSFMLLGFFRFFYDTHDYRYRIFQTKTDPKRPGGEPRIGISAPIAGAFPAVVFEANPRLLILNEPGEAVLNWRVTVPRIEVRADSPSGRKICEGGASGACPTGSVAQSTVYYLQDATRRDALRPDRTLARLELEHRPPRPALFIADPNPVRVADGSGRAAVRLRWDAPDVELVEIHVGSPDGPKFAQGGSFGLEVTPKWVTDGTKFFLQNVSGGRPLTLANTLGSLSVAVIDPVYSDETRRQEDSRSLYMTGLSPGFGSVESGELQSPLEGSRLPQPCSGW